MSGRQWTQAGCRSEVETDELLPRDEAVRAVLGAFEVLEVRLRVAGGLFACADALGPGMNDAAGQAPQYRVARGPQNSLLPPSPGSTFVSVSKIIVSASALLETFTL